MKKDEAFSFLLRRKRYLLLVPLILLVVTTFHRMTSKTVTETGNKLVSQTNDAANHFAFALKLNGYRARGVLVKRLTNCIASICERSTVSLVFHIIGDKEGNLTAAEVFANLREMCQRLNAKFLYYDLDEIVARLQGKITEIKHGTQDGAGMRRQPLYFFPIFMDVILPTDVDRVILLDADFYFQTDTKHLFEHFDNFKRTNIFGLARVQQPVYRRQFKRYRNSNPGTKVGDPPPDGITGYNGGLVMIDVKRMRSSKVYKKLLRDNAVKKYSAKYKFKGCRAEQDFFLLLDIEHHELFYVLPCSWNRQMCYFPSGFSSDIYKLYNDCSLPIHAYHGNCNAQMPNEKLYDSNT